MQKKIIALAVAGLISGVAFAQTNVTVYGAIDMAYEHRGNITKDAAAKNKNGKNGRVYNAIEQAGWDNSWFGLKGTEDLGNGLTVSFQQEFGTRPDVNGAKVAQRPSWVAINGKNWGSIKAGNFFIDNILFMTKGGFGNNGASEAPMRVGSNIWAPNAINYTSPNWSGVQFNLGYSSNFASGKDDNAKRSLNSPGWFGDVTYSNGPLFVGATYSHFNNDLADTPAAKGGPSLGAEFHEWNIGAAYDFKVANVGLVYNAYSSDVSTESYAVDRDVWRLNVGIPITAKDELYLSYVDVSIDKHKDGVKDPHQDGFALGYKHSLSKRTSLYAQAFWVDANDEVISSDEDSSGTLQQGYKVGVRHKF